MRLSDSHPVRGSWVAGALLPGLCSIVASFAGFNENSARTHSTVRIVALQRDSSAHNRPTAAPTYAPIGPATSAERALRRRVVRLARIKWLERRERELREFLARARSESPLFEQRSVDDLGAGILVGPTIVTRDFLGDAFVRAIVRNAAAVARAPLLTVHLTTLSGERDATIALDPMAPGASRRVELLVVTHAAPTGVRWSASPGF